jgi:ABC-type transport system substrate-binding protein
VGIKAELTVVDAARYNEYYYNGWKNGLLLNNMACEQNSISQLFRWLNPNTEYAVSTLRPAELSTILNKANNSSNYDEMKALCQDAVKLCYQQSILIPEYYAYGVTMEQPYVRGTGINVEAEAYRIYWNPGNAWLSK